MKHYLGWGRVCRGRVGSSILLEAEFARDRICKGSSLAGPTVAELESSFSYESASAYQ